MTVNLTTSWMGLTLPHPIVASACPLTGDLDALRRLEDAGVAAAVLPSLFEEQIEHDEMENHRFRDLHANASPEATSWFPEMDDYNSGLDGYLDHLRAAKDSVSFPIIGSLNGATPGGWVRYARWMEEAGADAVELNIYMIPTEPSQTGEDIERRYVDLVASVRNVVSVPLSVKIGPWFTSLPAIANRLFDAGADGLVIFNRYLHPDIDLETLEFSTRLSLTASDDICMPMRWIGILRGCLPEASLAATSGVRTPEDVIKLLLVGADVTMVARELMRYGPDAVTRMVTGLRDWLEHRGYVSVHQLQGSMSHRGQAHTDHYERANYMAALVNYAIPESDSPGAIDPNSGF